MSPHVATHVKLDIGSSSDAKFIEKTAKLIFKDRNELIEDVKSQFDFDIDVKYVQGVQDRIFVRAQNSTLELDAIVLLSPKDGDLSPEKADETIEKLNQIAEFLKSKYKAKRRN